MGCCVTQWSATMWCPDWLCLVACVQTSSLGKNYMIKRDLPVSWSLIEIHVLSSVRNEGDRIAFASPAKIAFLGLVPKPICRVPKCTECFWCRVGFPLRGFPATPTRCNSIVTEKKVLKGHRKSEEFDPKSTCRCIVVLCVIVQWIIVSRESQRQSRDTGK